MTSLTRTFAVAMSAVLLTLGISFGDSGDRIPASKHRETVSSRNVRVFVPESDAVMGVVGAATWLWAVDQAAQQAELERQERERIIAASRTTPSGFHPGTTDGECTGFAIPDYIIQRESGGNASAYNSSGAYGCAQTLLSHYSSGSCQGLDPFTIEGQRQCVDILSAGGTNLNPWAATR